VELVVSEQVKVLVVGAGFGGLATLGRLHLAGERDVLALERASEVGGTWRDNTYPGCACDIPSHLYSLSFAPNPNWSRAFSPQPEIQQYLRDVARDHGLLPGIRFGEEVLHATWDEGGQRWRVVTTSGVIEARFLVDTAGGLLDPVLPALPGLDCFTGTVFHSSRWRHDRDLRGRRVAVIGAGASAIQVVPAIVDRVESLVVVQRTAPWVIPRRDRPISALERRAYARLPWLQRLARWRQYIYREAVLFPAFTSRRLRGLFQTIFSAHLRRQVRDPELRVRLKPRFEIGCKRILISDDWYPALTKPHVTVIDGVRQVRATSIVASDGAEHEVDTLIAATGFDIIAPPIASRITGRDGQTLTEAWDGRPRSLHATTIDGFPNLFRFGAAGSVTGHNSHVAQIEAQVGYLIDAIRTLDALGADSAEPNATAVAADMAARRRDLSKTVWSLGGCQSWYQDADGVASVNWPRSSRRFHRELARFDASAYELRSRQPIVAGHPCGSQRRR
jgi:cation diffusion facilitator CzcD-associated flavoprotein CzcO